MDSVYIERMIMYLQQSGECWLWTKACDTQGYGRMWGGEKLVSIHQEMYKLFKGEIPAGMVVMHSCDIPNCGNPRHLSVGTQKQNLEDMTRKGRRPIGDTHGNTKITDKEVEEIKDLLRCGLFFQREVGEFYGITNRNISLISLGKSRSTSCAATTATSALPTTNSFPVQSTVTESTATSHTSG